MMKSDLDKKSATIVNAPEPTPFSGRYGYRPKVFLGGTIDNGNSEDWQKEVCEKLMKLNIIIFNPRRDPWPSDAGDKVVDEQIKWELDRLKESDLIIINILPDSKSPISLMELGLYAQSYKLMVFCDEKFYRYNNVKNVCEMYNIHLFNNNSSDFIADKILQSLVVMRSRIAYSSWEL